MKVALLGPVAWRTQPVAYGPWELLVSLLAEGRVARVVDVIAQEARRRFGADRMVTDYLASYESTVDR